MATEEFFVPAPGSERTFLRGLLQGASLGWADELESLVTGGDVEAVRDRNRQAADLSPSAYRGGQLVGGIGTALLPASWVARGIGGGVRAGQGLAGAARTGAIVGGTTGAVEALGEHENKTGDPLGAAVRTLGGGAFGTAVGGTLAPTLYALGAGVRAGGRVLADYAQGGSQAALRKTAEAL